MRPTALLVPLVALVAACWGPRETPFEALPDQTDVPGYSEVGIAPPAVHPPGIAFEVEASLVEQTTEDGEDRYFQVTLHAENGAPAPIELPARAFELRDDDGRTYHVAGVLLWDPEAEEYIDAPSEVAPGKRATVVIRFPASARIKLVRLIRLTLHWQYVYGGKTYRIATRFRVR